MIKSKQDKKDELERKHVQRVLDYRNKKYRTHVEIIDKAINVYPYLRERKRQLHWDLVCRDPETHEEIAIEVKEITKEEVYKRERSIDNILCEVKQSLSNKLPGVFVLRVTIDNKYDFPFKKQPKNKQAFKAILYKAIVEAAQKLNVGETIELLPKISEELPDDAIAPEAEKPLLTTRDELPFELPYNTFFNLRKLRSEGSGLGLGLPIGGSAFILEKFEQMVSRANEQLGIAKKEANVKDTFLVLIEESYNPKDPPEIAEAFTNISPESYSTIKHVYFIRGEKVAEIPLEPIVMDTDRQKLELDITQEFEVADDEATLLIDETK